MAESKETNSLRAINTDGNYYHYFYDGADVSCFDTVKSFATDIVSACHSHYLFYCYSSDLFSSNYYLYVGDISLSGNIYTIPVGSKFYSFSVRNTIDYNNRISDSGSIYFPNIVDGSTSSGSTRGTFNLGDNKEYVSSVISHGISVLDSSRTVTNDFAYSDLSDLRLVSHEGVNLLACIAFILAVIGCSLWFAAIFRNVQRR